MNKENYLKTGCAEVFYDATIPGVHVVWEGAPAKKDFRETMFFGLKMIEKHQVSKWMANTKKMGIILTEDREWTFRYWYPLAIDAGLRKLALIVPEDTYGELSAQNITEQANYTTPVVEDKYFTNIEDALVWLKADEG